MEAGQEEEWRQDRKKNGDRIGRGIVRMGFNAEWTPVILLNLVVAEAVEFD